MNRCFVNRQCIDCLMNSWRWLSFFIPLNARGWYLKYFMQLQEGGFRDKPGKHRDYYHTCYCLSGLSVAQYSYSKDADSPPLPRAVFGPYSNLLEPIHPLYNVILDLYHEAHEFFSTSWAYIFYWCLKFTGQGALDRWCYYVFVCFKFRNIR